MAISDDDRRTDVDREAILARRRRFVAAAITGLTTSTLATACPCLKVVPPTEGSTSDDPTGATTGESTSTAADASTSTDTGGSTSTSGSTDTGGSTSMGESTSTGGTTSTDTGTSTTAG